MFAVLGASGAAHADQTPAVPVTAPVTPAPGTPVPVTPVAAAAPTPSAPASVTPVTPDARPAQLGAMVEAPEGFLSFCTRHPGDCASSGDKDGAQAARFAHAELSRRWLQRLSQLRAGEPTEAWDNPASIAAMPRHDDTANDAAARDDAPKAGGPDAAKAGAPGDDLALLEAVSRRINHLIRPMSDQQHYGMEGFWATPIEDDAGAPYGDCKDYALEKRRALIAAGVEPAALALALVRTRWGEFHAVLVMSTASGEYVADSLTDRILPWRQTPYAWVARQDHGQPLVWRQIVG